MTTNNLPETWTIARDDMGVIRPMRVEVGLLEARALGMVGRGTGPMDAVAHLDRALARAGRAPRMIDLLGVSLGPRYEVFVVGMRGERFYRFVNALGCYAALRKAGKDCRLVNVDLLDGESDGLSELEREQVEAIQ